MLFRALVSLALITVCFGTAHAAHAADGVLEINQTCAAGPGCFAGDTGGFPVTIDGSAARSYLLTSDLVVPGDSTDGIFVSTNDIRIDLNGFRIVRAACVNATTSCIAGGFASGSGVERDVATNRGIAVENGSIVGMGFYGLLLGEQAHVHNVHVRWSRQDGIFVEEGSTVTDSTSYENGDDGIDSFESTVTGCTARNNANNGFESSTGTTYRGNTAYGNGRFGFETGNGTTISDSTSYQNTFSGISVSAGSVVRGSSAYQNGTVGIGIGGGSTVEASAAYNNTGDGISVSGGGAIANSTAHSNGGDGIQSVGAALIQRNLVSNNNGFGLRLGAGDAYRENVVTFNLGGTVFETAPAGGVPGTVDMGSNSCDGATSCP